MKKITLTWLERHDACEDAVAEWRERKLRSMDMLDLMRLLVLEKKDDWANWLFCKYANRKQRLKYAIHAAELALPIFEKEHPEDKRPRLAIEAVKRVLENDTQKNRAAACAAACAAWDAAGDAAGAAAWDAAVAARDAAWAAAWDAAWDAAGDAAGDAARDAARAAAWDAAQDAAWKDILNYGISLLEDK